MARIIDYINHGEQIEKWFDLAALEAEISDQVTRIELEELSYAFMKLSAEYDYVYTWGDQQTRAQYEKEAAMWTWAYANDPIK